MSRIGDDSSSRTRRLGSFSAFWFRSDIVALVMVVALSGAFFAAGCRRSATEPPPPVPEPDLTDMEPQVEKRMRETRAAVLASPRSAQAWGRFGMVAHAHELWAEAMTAYQQARKLDPSDVRWPYFLGDVLSVIGTDLGAAEQSFRRALELRPGYAPSHLRLGNLLLAGDRVEAAAAQFERALELEPSLNPARVALAQALLSREELDRSESLLLKVLADAPRHAQALSTLGQVYMRQGRLQEARGIAERARGAAKHNLFSDPLMGEVDSEARSAVVLWERARAFLDNGNYEQATRGLQLVVELQPSNVDVHHQLAVAYGNLGNLERSRHHLERAVALDPLRIEARILLATVDIEQQDPAAAVEHLRKVLELAPSDPDAGWLLGKAQVLAGDLGRGLSTFEAAHSRAAEIPAWAHNQWGRALAQTGDSEAALAHFRSALEADPEDTQALFFTGLVYEGGGRVDLAVKFYCGSMSSEENPPAANRLQALRRTCD